MSLNNLSVQQSENGDRAGALTSIQEAVQLRRTLAEARPEVFLPDLAMSLNNLSNQQSDNGDRAGALTSIQEAVQLRRTLAEARPEVFLPNLAATLNNLSVRQSENGDRAGALDLHPRSRPAPPHPGRSPPRGLPPRPRHVTEQPVQPAVRERGPGRGADLHHEAVQLYRTLAEARPEPSSSPTSPCH